MRLNIDLLSFGTDSGVDFRENPRRAGRRTKIKTEEIQNVTWAPHCAAATNTKLSRRLSRRNRTGHGRENKRRTHTHARARQRRPTGDDDAGRRTDNDSAEQKQSPRARHARSLLRGRCGG